MAQYGTAPSFDCVFEDFRLGRWLQNQKFAILRYPGYNRLHREKLTALLPQLLKTEEQPSPWDRHFQSLQRYIDSYGKLPGYDTVFEDFLLGHWICAQRHAMKQPDYPSDRRLLLEAAGVAPKTEDSIWNQNYALLKQYVAEFGELPRYDCVYQGFRLGLWCMNQRTKCRKPDYPTEQLARLEAIGLTKLPTRKSLWEDNLDLLREYKELYGTLPPSRCVYKGIRLGSWCSRNKAQAKHPDYPPERRQALQQIGLL